MYRERKKKWRTIKLVITEIIMIIAVIVTVILLTFFAMGYRVDKDGELDQQGLFQIQSFPTGATVTIDDDVLLSHTNTSKLVSAGDHTITLTKDGYDSWTKTVTSKLGWLIKIAYPRLFLKNRTVENVQELTEELSFFAPAANHDAVAYSTNNNPKWTLLDVRGDTAVKKELDLTDALSGLVVKNVTWNEDSNKVLVQASRGDKIEWLVVSISNPENTINLNQEFDMDFATVEFMDDSGDKLIALQSDANMRTIDVANKTISGVLAKQVSTFTHNGDKIFYLTTDNEVKISQSDEDDIIVASFGEGQKIKILASSYLDTKYLAVLEDNKFRVYTGDYPSSGHSLKDMTVALEEELEFTPDELKSAGYNELFVARSGLDMAVFDAEIDKLSTFKLPGEQMFFMDPYLVGTISDNNLVVSDFDGTNIRTLSRATGRAFITKNNKWMYYLDSSEGKTNILREQIMN
ncbi:PEGA domain-containing protein [Candidatus Saccharibacteria bacterium]|nr:PEGA domain-containing protein [Candidatus Saccharibacteria bacterium]